MTTKNYKGSLKVVEPELSYRIVGIAFKVSKELGFGYQEKYYQRAIEIELKKNGLKYEREILTNLVYRDKSIGSYRLDFIVEEKIVLEIKVGNYFHNKDFEQVKAYLKKTGLLLGIIVLFSPKGVQFKRVLQVDSCK